MCIMLYKLRLMFFWTGKYCIYRKGGYCPLDMKAGFYHWDDEWLNNQNAQDGEYPDGKYDHNTLIHFCCRIHGDKNVPISLPTHKPFFLLAYRSPECQQVKWTLATVEWLQYDTAGSGSRGFVYPFNGYLDDPTFYYCYYQSKLNLWFNYFSSQCLNEKAFFYWSQMSHESSYESVSRFSPKFSIRVRFRDWLRVRVG